MSEKAAKFRATFSFLLTTFGVCSVSLEAFSYPMSSVETIRFSRSSREAPPRKKQIIDSSPPKSPFAPDTHNLSIGIGQVFLLGELGNRYENSIAPELHYAYGVSDLFAFESSFSYHSHSNGNFSIWNLSAGLRTNLTYFDKLVPFANIGLGFFHPSLTYASGASASALLFGLQLGGGIDLMVTDRVFFGTRLTYHDMFNSTKKDSSGFSQSLGGAYLSFMIHAGLTF